MRKGGEVGFHSSQFKLEMQVNKYKVKWYDKFGHQPPLL